MNNSRMWQRLHAIEKIPYNKNDTPFYEFWEVWKKDLKNGTCEHLGTWLSWADAMRKKINFENWEDCGERYIYLIRHTFARWVL